MWHAPYHQTARSVPLFGTERPFWHIFIPKVAWSVPLLFTRNGMERTTFDIKSYQHIMLISFITIVIIIFQCMYIFVTKLKTIYNGKKITEVRNTCAY